MPTVTVFGGTNDAYNGGGSSPTYATARDMAGSSPGTVTGTSLIAGQTDALGTNTCWQSFIEFDTSQVGLHASVTAVTLSMWLQVAAGGTAFTMDCAAFAWGASVTTADSRTGSQLNGLTVLATRAHTVAEGTGAYKAFTESGTNFQTAIVRNGTTQLILYSARQVNAGVDPTNNESVNYASADTSGTSNDPKLDITFKVEGKNAMVI